MVIGKRMKTRVKVRPEQRGNWEGSYKEILMCFSKTLWKSVKGK